MPRRGPADPGPCAWQKTNVSTPPWSVTCALNAYLPAGSVPLARIVVAVSGLVPSISTAFVFRASKAFGRPPASPLSPLIPGGPWKPRGPRAPSWASRTSGVLRRLPDVHDLRDGVLRGVPERRRAEQGDDERGGGECDGEALQGAFEASTAPRCCLPDQNRGGLRTRFVDGQHASLLPKLCQELVAQVLAKRGQGELVTLGRGLVE